MKKQILYHSRYVANPFGHGGEKRTSQITEFYISEGYEIVELKLNEKSKINVLNLIKSFIVIYKVYGFSNWKSLNKFRKFVFDLAKKISHLEKYFSQDVNTFIWESVADEFYFLIYFAKKYKKEIIAYPHNIESLVANQKSALSNKFSPAGFEKEIKILSFCKEINVISRLEMQILTLFKLNPKFFPYYPPHEAIKMLKEIRLKRGIKKSSKIKEFLIIGTANNPPTLIGMNKLISKINEFNLNDIVFNFAGFGTEKLINKNSSNQINIKGSLTKTELICEMIACEALLINHPITTGALTRITEFLVAGVPVIINIDSAHSHFEMDGIFTFSSIENLKQLLISEYKIPNIP